MQSNTLTAGTISYDRFQEYPDRSVYTAPDHSIALNNLLSLSRVVPSTEGATARVRVKLVRDIVHPVTNEKSAIYVQADVSMPTWAKTTDVDVQAQQLALFIQTPAFGELLSKQSI